MNRRSIALVVAGIAIGSLLITPVGAHVSDSISHLWDGDQGHIKDKVKGFGDSRYQRLGANHNPLPAGKSLTGAVAGRIQSEGQYQLEAISWGGKLKFEPTVEFVAVDPKAPSDNCPGSPGNPEAEPGYLCVYNGYENADGVGWRGVWDPQGAGDCGCRRGATLFMSGSTSAEAATIWVLTAPTGQSG